MGPRHNQRGSPESRDPDKSPRAEKAATTRDMNKARERIHGGQAVVWLYSKSLGLALAVLFLISFWLHLVGSTREAAEEALDHGQPIPTLMEHLSGSEFWFESFQTGSRSSSRPPSSSCWPSSCARRIRGSRRRSPTPTPRPTPTRTRRNLRASPIRDLR